MTDDFSELDAQVAAHLRDSSTHKSRLIPKIDRSPTSRRSLQEVRTQRDLETHSFQESPQRTSFLSGCMFLVENAHSFLISLEKHEVSGDL